MKRTNKPKKKFKIIRTKKPINKRAKWELELERALPKEMLGGFLPHPPKDCDRIELARTYSGILWMDLSICHNCKRKPCPERKQWLKYLKITKLRKLTPTTKKK